LIEQFVATYSEAPSSITLDMDHTDDAAHGQQELAFYNHYYGHTWTPTFCQAFS
jgi:hypothetical protein